MKMLVSATALALLAGTAAFAQQAATTSERAQPMTTVPGNATPVNNFYRQNVYDPNDNKIGEVTDLLLEKDGRITAAIVSVGGFLGAGEKDVAVPFGSLQLTQKNQKWYLVMNTDKDALKSAPGFKKDRTQDRWVPENK